MYIYHIYTHSYPNLYKFSVVRQLVDDIVDEAVDKVLYPDTVPVDSNCDNSFSTD